MRAILDHLRSVQPLDPDDPDFHGVVEAMRDALVRARPAGLVAYWLVDPSGDGVGDMVSVVDLAALGRMALADPAGWDGRAARMSLHPLGDRDSVRWTLEGLMPLARASRLRGAAPAP